MGIKVISGPRDCTKPVKELKEHEIGVVTHWSTSTHVYIGYVVVVSGDDIKALGMGRGDSWPNGMTNPSINDACRVRVLQPGEMLEIISDA